MTRSHPDNIQPMFTPDAAGVERLAVGVLDMPNPSDGGQMVDPNPGSSVDLRDRSVTLLGALEDLGAANKLAGVRIKAETPAGYRELERRYGNVDKFLGNVTDKQTRHENDAKRQFAGGFGMAALAGFMSDQEAKKEARSEYEGFVRRFTKDDESAEDIAKSGGKKKTATQKRNQLKRKLAKHI